MFLYSHFQNSSSTPKPKCCECDVADAAVLCMQCDGERMFCQQCFDESHRARSMRTHKSTPILSTNTSVQDTAVPSSTAAAKPTDLICAIHKQAACLQCSGTTCSNFQIHEHASVDLPTHDLTVAAVAIEVLKKVIDDVRCTQHAVETQRKSLHAAVNTLCDMLIALLTTVAPRRSKISTPSR
jgi:hypothetical protein